MNMNETRQMYVHGFVDELKNFVLTFKLSIAKKIGFCGYFIILHSQRIIIMSPILLSEPCDFLRDIIVISDGNNKWRVRCEMVVTEPRQITSPGPRVSISQWELSMAAV